MLSVIIAVAMSVSTQADMPQVEEASHTSGPQIPGDVYADVADSESASAARAWVAVVDNGDWGGSWDQAADYFQSQVTRGTWAEMSRMVREPLGAVSARSFSKVTKTQSLPGAPDADYEVIEFSTSFANVGEATETVVMMLENGEWKLAGYFIR